MTEYGDVDPEDAYDEGDLDDVKLAILERVVVDLSDRHRRDDRFEFRRVDALRLAAKLAGTTGDIDRLNAVRVALEDLH